MAYQAKPIESKATGLEASRKLKPVGSLSSSQNRLKSSLGRLNNSLASLNSWSSEVKENLKSSVKNLRDSLTEIRQEKPVVRSKQLITSDIQSAKKWNRVSLAESDKFHSALDLGISLYNILANITFN